MNQRFTKQKYIMNLNFTYVVNLHQNIFRPKTGTLLGALETRLASKMSASSKKPLGVIFDKVE
jgi:hypothetical protein